MVSIGMEENKQNNNLQNFVAVTVKDSGTGIDSEMFPRLFEKIALKSCKGEKNCYHFEGIVTSEDEFNKYPLYSLQRKNPITSWQEQQRYFVN